MKKDIIIILILFIIINFLLIFKLSTKKETKEFLGTKINNYLYNYEINSNTKYQIIDDTIYFLINEENTYKFYKLNIYNNKTELINKIKTNYCEFKNDYILCTNEKQLNIYDLNFKLIYQTTNNNKRSLRVLKIL